VAPAGPPPAGPVTTTTAVAVAPHASEGGGASDPTRHRAGRDLVGIAFLVLGAVLLAAGSVTTWAADVADDPATYEDASVIDLGEGGLSRLVRERVSTATMDALDLDGMIASALPGPLGALGGPAEDLGQTVVDEAIDAVLSEPTIAGLIDDLEVRADEELVALLLDESELLRLDGDTVLLDLDPLVAQVIARIDGSLPGWAQGIPGVSAGALVPDEIENSGVEVELAEMPAVADGRASLDRLERLPSTLYAAGAALVLAGLVLARRRGRALAAFGIALASAAALFLAGSLVWGGWPLAGITAPLEAIAGQTFADAGGDALVDRSLVVLALAAVALVAGLVWDRTATRPARPTGS
jgi:hypothetical protein